MKKIFFLVLVMSSFFIVRVSAQNKQEMVKQQLMDSLKISATTADSVIAITKESVTKARSIMKDQSLSQDEKREQMKPIKEEAKMRLEKFLNEEQMQKLQQIGIERRQNRNANK
jgi:hypothetical protein